MQMKFFILVVVLAVMTVWMNRYSITVTAGGQAFRINSITGCTMVLKHDGKAREVDNTCW